MPAILFVRITSELSGEKVDHRILERLPRFREIPGLVQKIFGRDPDSGEICGIYFFEDEIALASYRDSELAKSIPAAYEAMDVRRETFQALCSLYPERGPFLQ